MNRFIAIFLIVFSLVCCITIAGTPLYLMDKFNNLTFAWLLLFSIPFACACGYSSIDETVKYWWD